VAICRYVFNILQKDKNEKNKEFELRRGTKLKRFIEQLPVNFLLLFYLFFLIDPSINLTFELKSDMEQITGYEKIH